MSRSTIAALAAVFALTLAPQALLADGKKPLDKAGVAAGKKIKKLKADQPFWTWLAAPHGREIAIILSKVEENRQLSRNWTMFSYQSGGFQAKTVAEKQRAFDDAIGLLRYARRLDPDNTLILAALADVAHAAGRSDDTIEACEALLALPNESGDRFVGQHAALGLIYARRGEWEKASQHLEVGVGEGYTPYFTVSLTYALVEMERGRLDQAIDFLRSTNSSDNYFMQLALAVAYDRNDEEARAAATLDSLQKSQTLNSAMNAPWGTDVLPFTPAHDLHYFRALLYETSGHLAEARAEWVAYLRADPNARYRFKARRHVAEIDGRADTRPATKPVAVPGGLFPGASPPPLTP